MRSSTKYSVDYTSGLKPPERSNDISRRDQSITYAAPTSPSKRGWADFGRTLALEASPKTTRLFYDFEAQYLSQEGVCLKAAELFSTRFDHYNIARLIKHDVDHQAANAYHERFSAYDVVTLAEHDIDHQAANAYHERFSAYDVVTLAEHDIDHQAANAYHERFSAQEIIDLFNDEIDYQVANAYHDKYSGYHVVDFVNYGIDPDTIKQLASAYNESFSGSDIVHLLNQRINPQFANKLLEDYKNIQFFSPAVEILSLHEAGIDPVIASEYPSKLWAHDIVLLYQKNITPKMFQSLVQTYGEKFTERDIIELIQLEIPPEKANELADAYSTKFARNNIVKLIKLGISPEKADDFIGRCNADVSGSDIVNLLEANIQPELANQFGNIAPYHISTLIEGGFDQSLMAEADNYQGRFFTVRDLILLHKMNLHVQPDFVNACHKRFTAKDIVEFYDKGIGYDTANQYSKRLDGMEISLLYRMNVNPSLADELIANYPRGCEISTCYEHKISPDTAKDCLERVKSYREPLGIGFNDVLFLTNHLLGKRLDPNLIQSLLPQFHNIRTEKYEPEERVRQIVNGLTKIQFTNMYEETGLPCFDPIFLKDRFNIETLGYLTPKLAKIISKNLDPTHNADKPIAFVFLPQHDNNNAFLGISEDLMALSTDYKLFVFEGDKTNLEKSLREITYLHGQNDKGEPLKPINLLLLCGHGEKNKLYLSSDSIVGSSDTELFETIAQSMNKKSFCSLVLVSCSTGKGDGTTSSNLAFSIFNHLDKVLKLSVFAPIQDAGSRLEVSVREPKTPTFKFLYSPTLYLCSLETLQQ